MLANESLDRALSTINSESPNAFTLTTNGKELAPKAYIPRAATPPTLSFTTSAPLTYIALAVDLDAPFVSFSPLSPILHWAQSGLKQKAGSQVLVSADEAIATWHPAGPPPGAAPHRYVFLLYEQPTKFDIKKPAMVSSVWSRVRFDLDKWVKEVGLGEPVGVTYFTSN